MEAIHQVGLELHQRELLAIETEMLQQINIRCFNDMRTILLVHDKQMLRIVKQELTETTYRTQCAHSDSGTGSRQGDYAHNLSMNFLSV